MDLLEILKTILELWNYPDQTTEVEQKECQRLIRKRATEMMFLASVFCLFLIVVLCICSFNLSEDILDTIVLKKLLWWKGVSFSALLWTCFILGFLICLATFVYAIGIKRNWKLRNESEFVDIRYVQDLFNERYELDNRRCSECDKYSYTGRLIVKALENRSHLKFISFFKEATRLNPDELNLIKEDFKIEPKYAKLLCVLSNPQYFTPDENEIQLEQLTHYFISFYPFINNQKRVKRVFSLSAIGKKSDQNYCKKAKWLLQYLLINSITGVETCLLVDEEGLKIHVDYVVGKFPEGDYRLYSKRKSYFSYEVEGEKDKDYTIQCSDQLFTNILETDFYERWKGLNEKKQERKRLSAKNGNWGEIKQQLELKDEDTEAVVLLLAKHIKSCKDGYLSDPDRVALFNGLREVIDDRSLNIEKDRKRYILKEIKRIQDS